MKSLGKSHWLATAYEITCVASSKREILETRKAQNRSKKKKNFH